MIVDSAYIVGSTPRRGSGVHDHREVLVGVGREIGDHEIIQRHGKRQQRAGHDAGHDLRQNDLRTAPLSGLQPRSSAAS